MIWFWCGLGATVVGSLAYAIWRRPSAKQAAVAIDEKLALKEKFSTALYVRPSADPFAMAAVRDAERTAEQVRLQKQFPFAFPRVGYATLGVALLALLTFEFLAPMDLFGHKEAQKKQLEQQQAQKIAKENVERALLAVESLPQSVAGNEEFKIAQKDLEKLLHQQSIPDPSKANRRAMQALQDVSDALSK